METPKKCCSSSPVAVSRWWYFLPRRWRKKLFFN